MYDLNDHPFSPANIRYECGEETAAERRFSRFCADVSRRLGVDINDGDQATDGYSLDWAYDMWRDGATAADCAAEFRALMSLVRPGGCGAGRITIGKHVQGAGDFNASMDGRVVACAFLHANGELAVHDIVRGGEPQLANDPGRAHDIMLAIAKREADIADLEEPGGCGAQRLEATHLRGKRWAVRPQGQLGTCGWAPAPWTVVYVNADNAEAAVRKARALAEIVEELERPGGCGAQRLGIYWTARSVNKKTGPIPVSTTSAETCPSACPLAKSGCYAKGGNVGILWHALTRHGPNASWKHGASMARSIDWTGLCERVAALPEGTLWRHNQAGDLPHRKQRIMRGRLMALVAANRGKRGFTYTHHIMRGDDNRSAWNAALVRWANAMGFTVNLSANTLAHADELSESSAGPVVVVLSFAAPRTTTTPAGRTVRTCPATYAEVTCKQCQWCAMPARDWIVGFPPHGGQKNAANAIAEGAR